MSLHIASICALGALGSLQGASLYSPVRSVEDQGITLKAWGSGSIAETDEVAYEGSRSIRVSTRNYFQGGVMSLASAVDLSGAYGNKNNLLRIAVRLADLNLTFTSGGTGRPGGGGRVGGDPDVGTAGSGAGAGGGAAVGGGRPGGGGETGAQTPDNALKNLRLIVTTADGKKSEAYVPITTGGSSRGWIFVSIPLHAIAGFAESNKAIKEVGISGDAISTFYVGEMRIVNDSTPITGEIRVGQIIAVGSYGGSGGGNAPNYGTNQNLNLALGDEVEFVGYGFGGSSILKYSWDFDATDGIQTDSEGQAVRRKFRKDSSNQPNGAYTITLVISDVHGLKTPYTTKMYVKVNP